MRNTHTCTHAHHAHRTTHAHPAGSHAIPVSTHGSSVNLGIEVLTLYAFSTENWQRPQQEVDVLIELMVTTIRNEVEHMRTNNVRLRIIGDTSRFDETKRSALDHAVAQTQHCTGMELVIALSYSGRWDIENAVKKIVLDCTDRVKAGAVGSALPTIDATLIEQHLSTAGLPDPDLLIRTGGEMRVSNFLLWQLAYTEIFVTDTLWPDFGEENLHEALRSYEQRQRRYGKVPTVDTH
eukprot:TRINITY_DN964_c0_g1_i2.p1 TRINITY_DN964_c0_g1~~TRINITY_DN964_c0_g1_i2.p1  ORF type:complete len:237 (-),score=30.74 TRINITY_DN964_c0_g1_i2:34-744(-)